MREGEPLLGSTVSHGRSSLSRSRNSSKQSAALATGKRPYPSDWMDDAAVAIVIVVDPTEHPNHFVEDGAIAAQNMALAGHGLGYASFYLGLSERKAGDASPEEEVKQLLQVPERMRVIAILPIGIPERVPGSSRKELHPLIHHNMYGHHKS
jgi:nitroreductase